MDLNITRPDIEKLRAVTATAAEINAMAGISTAEMAFVDGTTAGTLIASKALIVGATKNIDTLLFNVQALSAAGSTQANGGVITGDTVLVAGADDTKAVVLPTAVAGRRIVLINLVADKHLHVFPNASPGSVVINALTADAAITVPMASVAVFYATSATQWYATVVPHGMTASAAEINTLTASGVTNADLVKLHAVTATAANLNNAQSFFDVTVTTTAVNAGTATIVPAISLKQFFPTFAAFQCAGSVSVATVVGLVESTSVGVVLSHPAADCLTTVWNGPTGGTPTITLLNSALTVSEGIKCVATGTLTTTTAVRCIVAGYYI